MYVDAWREVVGHLLHVGHAESVPVADVAVEACATATDSTVTAVHILAKEETHVRDEGHLQYMTRARCGGQGVELIIGKYVAESIKSGCICGSLHPRC